MACLSDTLGSPWPPLAIRPCQETKHFCATQLASTRDAFLSSFLTVVKALSPNHLRIFNLSVHASVLLPWPSWPSVCLSVCHLPVCPSVCLSDLLPVFLSACLHTRQAVCLAICSAVHSAVYPTVPLANLKSRSCRQKVYRHP
jgi:hypothetical protein